MQRATQGLLAVDVKALGPALVWRQVKLSEGGANLWTCTSKHSHGSVDCPQLAWQRRLPLHQPWIKLDPGQLLSVCSTRYASPLPLYPHAGEASSPDDCQWLMAQTRYRCPILEYCGGVPGQVWYCEHDQCLHWASPKAGLRYMSCIPLRFPVLACTHKALSHVPNAGRYRDWRRLLVRHPTATAGTAS